MTIAKLDLLKAQLRAFKTTLEKTPTSQKEGFASMTIANNFNRILKDVSESYPDIASSLPTAIGKMSGPAGRLGDSSRAHYLDVEIFAEQILSILDLVGD